MTQVHIEVYLIGRLTRNRMAHCLPVAQVYSYVYLIGRITRKGMAQCAYLLVD